MKLDRKIILSILALGVSPFIMASTESLVGFVLNSSLKEFGDIYISALTILQSAMQFASAPFVRIRTFLRSIDFSVELPLFILSQLFPPFEIGPFTSNTSSGKTTFAVRPTLPHLKLCFHVV